MDGNGCNGNCCTAFYLPNEYQWFQDNQKKVTDGEFIADMLIPMTPDEARQRRVLFGAGAGDVKDDGNYFTCRHFDEATRLCREYDNRPNMCRSFPYGNVCHQCHSCTDDYPMDTISQYVHKLEHGNRFGVARYGDGEWGAILGKIDGTKYGDKVTPKLADAIRNTLLKPKPYFYASLGEPWSREVNAWIEQHNIKCRWAKKQVLEQASRDGELLPFLEALRERDVLVVGLPHLGKMRSLIGCRNCIIPDVNCYGETLDPKLFKADVVLFACGLASVTFIHDLWDKTDATLIDIGSLFDPYCGVESRRGHKTPEFRENVRKTLEALNGQNERSEQDRIGAASTRIQTKAKEDAGGI